jgi:hypothetical protein
MNIGAPDGVGVGAAGACDAVPVNPAVPGRCPKGSAVERNEPEPPSGTDGR